MKKGTFYYKGSVEQSLKEDYSESSATDNRKLAIVADGVSWAYGPEVGSEIPELLEIGLTQVLYKLDGKWSKVTIEQLLNTKPKVSPNYGATTSGAFAAKQITDCVAYANSSQSIENSILLANQRLNDLLPISTDQINGLNNSSQRPGCCLSALEINNDTSGLALAAGDSRYILETRSGLIITSTNEVEEVEKDRAKVFNACALVAKELGISCWTLYKYFFAYARNQEANIEYSFADGSASFKICQKYTFKKNEIQCAIICTDGAVPNTSGSKPNFWQNKLIQAVKAEDITGYFDWLKEVNAEGFDKNAPNPEATVVWYLF